MRWTQLLSILSLGISSLLLASCGTTRQIAGDSYCQVYEPIIQKKGEGQITAALAVKQRILYNEQMYRTECKKVGASK